MQPSKFTLLLQVTQPLVVYPQLAECFGLNEAIILQKVHWWCLTNEERESRKKLKTHYKNEEWWCYNTFDEWQVTFNWWALRTIKGIIGKLENEKLLVAGNYNQTKFDRTKWYRVNYEEVISKFNVFYGSKEANLPIVQNLHDASGNTCTMDSAEVAQSNGQGSHDVYTTYINQIKTKEEASKILDTIQNPTTRALIEKEYRLKGFL